MKVTLRDVTITLQEMRVEMSKISLILKWRVVTACGFSVLMCHTVLDSFLLVDVTIVSVVKKEWHVPCQRL